MGRDRTYILYLYLYLVSGSGFDMLPISINAQNTIPGCENVSMRNFGVDDDHDDDG